MLGSQLLLTDGEGLHQEQFCAAILPSFLQTSTCLFKQLCGVRGHNRFLLDQVDTDQSVWKITFTARPLLKWNLWKGSIHCLHDTLDPLPKLLRVQSILDHCLNQTMQRKNALFAVTFDERIPPQGAD